MNEPNVKARKRVAIVGATGYSGAELTAILARHHGVELVALFSSSSTARGPVTPTLPNLIAEPFTLEALVASNAFVVDACRHVVRHAGAAISLVKRPVLFALARALGEAWPGDAPRDILVARAFRLKLADESHRTRLRVEVGRLRKVLGTLADVRATKRGFALAPRRAREVVVLALPVDEKHAAMLALIADGESWSSSALALALGTSQRSAQRAIDSLAAAGKVQSFGRGRARRWLSPPVPGFTTTLLLPAPFAN